MSSLSIISDCVACLHSDPLRYWPVLLLLLGQLSLNSKGFVGGLQYDVRSQDKTMLIIECKKDCC